MVLSFSVLGTADTAELEQFWNIYFYVARLLMAL